MDDLEQVAIDDFDRQQRLAEASASRRVEQEVLGSNYGATSYATQRQVDELARRVQLGPGVLLLDVGAGSGWPALHLAATTGCRVVLADQPEAGLRIARRRAATDRLDDRCGVVAAAGELLPFRSRMFDAVTHADVLC